MTIRSILFSIFTILVIVFATSSCQEDTYVSDAERIAAEERIFIQFLNENYDAYTDSSVIIDTTYITDATNGDIDTIINRRVFGKKDVVDLVYWEKETGVGDTITKDQQVGYRCKIYTLEFNEETESVDKILYLNVFNNLYPNDVIIDQRNAQGYLVPFFGFNEGLKHMKLNGKAWMLMPSSQANPTSYLSLFYEVEVVYVSR